MRATGCQREGATDRGGWGLTIPPSHPPAPVIKTTFLDMLRVVLSKCL